GQVAIHAKFDKDIYLPEDAEFYFVYDGSLNRHIMFAERVSDNTLRSIVPGHGCQEAISVSVLMYTRGYSPVVLGSCPVTYRENLSCKLSRFLVNHAECVTTAGHKMLLDTFGLRIKDLQSLDNNLVMAVAHEELPSTWNIIGGGLEGEPKCKEALLHLVMKLGLVKLSQFLAAQPGGSLALALPNEDGATPLDLALQNGHARLVDFFTNFQGRHSVDISEVEISEGACVQFVHSSGALTLTFSQTAQHLLESDIKLFRKYFWDRPLLYQVGSFSPLIFNCNSRRVMERLKQTGCCDKLELPTWQPCLHWILSGALQFKKCKRTGFVAVLEQRHSTLDILRKLKAPPALFAANRLPAMLSGSDEVYANCMVVHQAGDLRTCNIHEDGVSSEISLNPTNSIPRAKSSSSPSLEEDDQYIHVPKEGNKRPEKCGENAGLKSTVSPSNPYGADSYLPFKTHGFIKGWSQLYADMKRRSSSLDDLEIDDGSGDVSSRSHVHYPPLGSSETMACSRDGLDLPPSLQPKECIVYGIRARSYSCSSSKGSLGRPHIPRDFTAGHPSEGQCSGFALAWP
ncbi:Rho-guanine nucleotide exchange factor, partial [Chaetura pelagica]